MVRSGPEQNGDDYESCSRCNSYIEDISGRFVDPPIYFAVVVVVVVIGIVFVDSSSASLIPTQLQTP